MDLGWSGGGRFSFWVKALARAGLVAAADSLFFGTGVGATLGCFALGWLTIMLVLKRAVRRDRRSLFGAGAASVLAILLIDHFSLIGFALFWAAITVAALSPRLAPREDAWGWTKRIATHAFVSIAGPVRDFQRLQRLAPIGRVSWRSLLAIWLLPLGGGAVFLALFASANPIIAGVLSAIKFPEISPIFALRLISWAATFIAVWATLRPLKRRRRHARTTPRQPRPKVQQPSFSLDSVTLALIVFNALFALENTLDLAFLWSGAGLPNGVTLAQYAHRGAYPLIATALLAAGFSLFILREGSSTADNRLVRGLVGFWVAQNILLSSSSILRTLNYVQAYSMTRFRLAALLWMGLVTIGLVLIAWRMLFGKSVCWLINANALALGIVLSTACVWDLGAIAAYWNVRHTRDVGGTGAALDVCYLQTLGPSALLPLLELEQQRLRPDLRARAVAVQVQDLQELRSRQLQWRRWTWQGARRLQAAEQTLALHPQLGRLSIENVGCDQQELALSPVTPSSAATILLAPNGHGNPLTPRAQP
jgi:hypothetical protein